MYLRIYSSSDTLSGNTLAAGLDHRDSLEIEICGSNRVTYLCRLMWVVNCEIISGQ